MSKYAILLSFYSNLNKFHNLNLQKESTKEKKVTVYDNASELNNVIRDPETFSYDLDRHKNFDENLKNEIEFIIESNGSLAEDKIKNELESKI